MVSEVDSPSVLLAARSAAYPQAGLASLAGRLMASFERFLWLSVFKRVEECSLDLHTVDSGGSFSADVAGAERKGGSSTRLSVALTSLS